VLQASSTSYLVTSSPLCTARVQNHSAMQSQAKKQSNKKKNETEVSRSVETGRIQVLSLTRVYHAVQCRGSKVSSGGVQQECVYAAYWVCGGNGMCLIVCQYVCVRSCACVYVHVCVSPVWTSLMDSKKARDPSSCLRSST
jgi:hypothetical protein